MKHLIILRRVLLCAMLLLLSLSVSAQTAPFAEALPDTTTLSSTDYAMPTLPEWIPVFTIGFELILLIITFYMLLSTRKQLELEQLRNEELEQLRNKSYKKAGKEPRQVSLTITCDEGHTADFLRELATVIEDRDNDDSSPDFEYETFHGCAELTTED